MLGQTASCRGQDKHVFWRHTDLFGILNLMLTGTQPWEIYITPSMKQEELFLPLGEHHSRRGAQRLPRCHLLTNVNLLHFHFPSSSSTILRTQLPFHTQVLIKENVWCFYFLNTQLLETGLTLPCLCLVNHLLASGKWSENSLSFQLLSNRNLELESSVSTEWNSKAIDYE